MHERERSYDVGDGTETRSSEDPGQATERHAGENLPERPGERARRERYPKVSCDYGCRCYQGQYASYYNGKKKIKKKIFSRITISMSIKENFFEIFRIFPSNPTNAYRPLNSSAGMQHHCRNSQSGTSQSSKRQPPKNATKTPTAPNGPNFSPLNLRGTDVQRPDLPKKKQ